MDTQAIRKKILDLALRGKLTEQLPDDGTAEELFQRIQQEKSIQKKAGKRKKDEPDAASAQRDIPFDLPSSWMWVEIGEIFTLQAGKNITADRIADKQSDLYSYPCYGGNGLRGFVEHYNTSGLHALIGRQGALCGNINFAEGDFYATEHAVVVDVYAETDIIWAGLFLKALNLNQYATSVAQPGLAVNRIEKVLIPLPPISEQKRIVEKIESSYSILDTIDTLQSQYQENLATLKSKIIDAGIQGKLTEQLPEDGTAEELYQQIQAEKQALIKAGKVKKEKPLPKIAGNDVPFDIPTTWKWIRWGELSNQIQYGYNAPAKETGRIRMVRITDIQENHVNWSTVPFCDIDEEDIEWYRVQPNDILFARTGGTVGKSYLVETVEEDAVFAGYLIRTSYSQDLNAKYMKYFMESRLYWKQLQDGTTATAQPNCNAKTLSKMMLPLPPLAEQKRIVQKLDEVLKMVEA